MIDVRLQRLQADYEGIRALERRLKRIRIDSVAGSPPERYRFHLNVKSLRESGGTIRLAEEHKLEVRLPLTYPRDGPLCRMLTPVFHPNIAPHQVCIGDQWTAGESLEDLVLRICSMLAYQSYNTKSPLNGEAAEWVEKHVGELPFDTTEFLGILADDPVAREDSCQNCNGEGTLAFCPSGHRLCADCLFPCPACGRQLCVVCGDLPCPACLKAHADLSEASDTRATE